MAKNERLLFHSRLPPVALAHKMLALIGKDENAQAVEGVIGNGNEQEISLFVKRGGGMPTTEFEARLEAEGSGTRIEGKIGAPLGFGCFTIFSVGMALSSLGLGLNYILSDGDPFGAFMFIFVGIILLTAFSGIVWKAKKEAAGDRAKILNFIQTHLEIVAHENVQIPDKKRVE